ncbi:tail fiber assembly protein [Enterobacter hormaechei]|uniref:tail fiber assembly protein n=1 Tax=Enterobacter hormaechei TaxID=158836 RepID=UPI0023E3E412|nr:tail fiber assembly protein [Enterobacter hormaechei]MCM8191928.1 tail fiber assembly protein [Enterobacter hormaechei]MDF3724929.1 tail fiber assembly protein [Enterobacter hormaechei]MEB7343435.1 tail fiber assembly protein [Enterobacter hormaechei]
MGETNYIFSAALNGFLPLAWKEEKEATGSWPDDAVEISYEDYLKFTTDAPEGKILGSVDGRPAWVDIPPPTLDELIASAEATKLSLKAKTDSEIAWRQDAVDADIATDEETAALADWKKYRVLLMRVDTAKPVWPTLPTA